MSTNLKVGHGTIYISIFLEYYNLATGLKSLPVTKGKPNLNPKIKKMIPIRVNSDESDEPSSVSSPADGSQGDNSSNSNDDEDEEDNDFDVAQMTDREARKMLDDEVLSFLF